MTRKIALLAAALVSLGRASADAQPASPSSEMHEYRIASWAGGDGVTLGAVREISQDEDGYLWLASEAGLARFDGLRFVTSGLVDRVELPAVPARALHRATDGSLWVGYGGGHGVYHIVQGEARGTYLQNEISGFINAITEGRSGTVWIAHDEGLHRLVNGRTERVHVPAPGPDRRVFDILEDRSGTLWVGAAQGLFRRPPGGAFEQAPVSTGIVRSISEDQAGRVWVTDDVAGFRPADAAPRHTLTSRGMSLFHDHEGNLWVATIGQGLWKVRHGTVDSMTPAVERATVDRGLLSDETSGFLEDRDGNLWAGANMGLHRLSRNKVISLVDIGIVRSVVAAAGDTTWVGGTKGLIAVSGLRTGSRSIRHAVDPAPVRTLHQALDGTLWVATGEGLRKLAGGRLSRASVNGVPLSRITSITSDRRGSLWLSDEVQGIVRVDGTASERVSLSSAGSARRPTLVYIDGEDRLWAAFDDGTASMRRADGVIRHYGPSEGLSHRTISVIHSDRRGRLWIGGDGGLSLLLGDRFATLTSDRGLPSPPIVQIMDDESGNVWAGLWFFGFIRLDPGDLERAVADPSHRLHYPVYKTSSGTAGPPDRLNSSSAARDSNGRLWFVTSRGLTVIDPRVLRSQHGVSPGPPRIEGVTADSQRYRPVSRATLPPRVNRLSIDYAVINLSSFDQIRFRYRLDGFDNGWVDGTGRRQASYTNLPPGEYRFRLQAATAAVQWDEQEVAWAFSIAPAFYQTRWFHLASAVALALAVGSVWRLRMRHVRRQLAAVLNERIRLSREIHDTLLQSLVGVALQLDVAAGAADDTSAMRRSRLVRMRKQVEEYIREARQSIWELRTTSGSRDIVTALREMGERLTAGRVRFDLSVSGAQRACDDKVETQVLRVAQEALTNAVRHANARHVNMDVSFAERRLHVRIADDGRGFDPEASSRISGHYGLVGMMERAAEVGGRCTIESAPGIGSRIIAEFPLAS